MNGLYSRSILRRLGDQPLGFLEFHTCQRELAFGLERLPEVGMGKRVFGVKAQSGAILGDGAVAVPFGLETSPQIKVGEHVVGMEAEGSAILGAGAVAVPPVTERGPEVGMGK